MRIHNALALRYLDYRCVMWQDCVKVFQRKVERIQIMYTVRLNVSKPPRALHDDVRKIMNWIPLTECREILN